MSAVQIPQSTSRIVRLKMFLTGTTTPATGKTVAVTLAKTSGDYANPSAGATNATEISNGWYYFTASTTDTGTLGDLVAKGTTSGCDDSERLFAVVKATNGGLTGVPDAAANTNGGLPILSSSGTTLAYTISTLTTYTNNTPQAGDAYLLLTGTGAVTFASLTVSGATTLTGNVSLAAGLTVTQSTTNGNAVSLTGNGSGAGLSVTSGSTSGASAMKITGTGTSSHGLTITATGSRNAVNLTASTGFTILSANNSLGAVSITGLVAQTVTISGAVELQSTLNVIGATTLAAVSASGAVTLNITGTVSGNAPASTALSTADWSTARAAKLDNLDTTVGSRVATSALPTHFSSLAITAAGGVTLADGVAHGGTLGSSTATLALSRVNVVSQTTDTIAFLIQGNGSAYALSVAAPGSGGAFQVVTSGAGDALVLNSASGTDFRLLNQTTNLTLAKGTGITGFNDITAASVWAAGTRTLTAFSFNVSLAATQSLYAPAKAGDSMALTTNERDSTADALLARNIAGGSSTGRIVSQALYALRNKVDMTLGRVYGVDDSTVSWSFVVTTDASVDPVVVLDPG